MAKVYYWTVDEEEYYPRDVISLRPPVNEEAKELVEKVNYDIAVTVLKETLADYEDSCREGDPWINASNIEEVIKELEGDQSE